MRTKRRSRNRRSDRLHSVAAIVVAIALASGCEGAVAPVGSTNRPSPTEPSASAASPSPSLTLPTPPSTPTDIGGRWEAAGTMAVGRKGAHAVLLGDGRVLVIGGSTAYGEESHPSLVAELWDPATGAWHTTAGLNKAREDFVAVPLADGRALVTGGTNEAGQSYSSTYVYDPRPGRETWSKVGLLGTARTDPAAAALPDGRVLVAGGYYHVKPTYGRAPAGKTVLAAYPAAAFPESASSGPRLADIEPPHLGEALATAELFDPVTGRWSATGSLNYARFGASAVTLVDGRVLVVGSLGWDRGVTTDERSYDSAEVYDPETGRFSLIGSLPEMDWANLARSLGVSGFDADPFVDPVPDSNGSLVALQDGGAVLVGHAGYWKHEGAITRSFRFDAQSGDWTEIGQTYIGMWEPGPETDVVVLQTPGVRRLVGAFVARLPDGNILIAGGASADAFSFSTALADLYDPATNTWLPLLPMTEARGSGAAVTLPDGSVLLVGGVDDSQGGTGVLASAIRFVPSD